MTISERRMFNEQHFFYLSADNNLMIKRPESDVPNEESEI
jgi:hypothetical protein